MHQFPFSAAIAGACDLDLGPSALRCVAAGRGLVHRTKISVPYPPLTVTAQYCSVLKEAGYRMNTPPLSL
jgi:hypothetical protein